ncbi:hypothetical protein AYO44_07505 [Planctomycetaceae bacterium SCGC AG-212-F19]|nr:hypothetical protein AYO44_07505 [Planctomycetaceae bacterium SCGC AG-212-F19]
MNGVIQVRGQQYRQLVEALTNAFPNVNALTMMLQYRLEKALPQIAALPNPIDQVAFEVVGASNAQGWTAELITAARESSPKNPRLLKLAEDFGLTAATAELERKVRDDLSYLDITKWRARLGEIESQVCLVETPPAMGTGFLLGPDVVITNYHLMKDVIAKPALAEQVVFRFDYKKLADGTTVNPGTEFRLVKNNWLLDHSPYSKVDLLADPGDQTPGPEELDYALLRVENRPGNQSVAAAKAEPGLENRGWIKPKDGAYAVPVDAPIFIVQHPEALPLKLALDTKSVLLTNANSTRLRYRTNTEKGSSGSPVFNEHWELIALHHSGDRTIVPVYNQGIPFSTILKLLEQRGTKKFLDQPSN